MEQQNRSNQQFDKIVAELHNIVFKRAPSREAEVEEAIFTHLKNKRFPVRRQVVIANDRFDIVSGRIIIEVKNQGQRNIAEQIDRYSKYCDGIIVVCWKATQPLRLIFAKAKQNQQAIPIELIELTQNCSMV